MSCDWICVRLTCHVTVDLCEVGVSCDCGSVWG